MIKNEIIELITSKDQKATYDAFCKMIHEEENNQEIAAYYLDYLALLGSSKSYIRFKAFVMIVKTAKFLDSQVLIKDIKEILSIMDDEKPTVVRQAISLMPELSQVDTRIKKDIIDKLECIDLNRFKDTMAPLIKKDIANVLVILVEL